MHEDLPFEAMLRGIGDALIYADREGIIRWWNPGAETLFGFTREEAEGASLDIMIPEKIRAAHWQGFHSAVETGVSKYYGKVMRTRGIHKTHGKVYIELSLNLVKNPAGEVLGSIAMARSAPPDAR